MKYEVKCTLGTLDKVIEAIEEIASRRDYNALIDNFIEELADFGVEQGQENWSKGIKYAGDTSVSLDKKREDNKTKVQVHGENVAFMEFGAGATYGVATEFGFTAGSYGKGQGGTRHPWTYYGKRGTTGLIARNKKGNARHHGRHERVYWTYGNPPNRKMMDTAEDMRANMFTIADMVFDND